MSEIISYRAVDLPFSEEGGNMGFGFFLGCLQTAVLLVDFWATSVDMI